MKVDKWYKIAQNQFIHADYVRLEDAGTAATATQQATTTVDGLNVRTDAGTQFASVRKLALGTTVTLLESRDGWYRIGNHEWVIGRYLSVVK